MEASAIASARVVRLSFTVLAAVAAACSNPSTPAQPSAPTATTASDAATSSATSLTGSVTTPRLLQPANGAQIRNLDQPVTLLVENAVVTKPGDTTYTFEVATDAGFTAKVQTKDGVAEGSGGQTSVKLDALAAARDYYWHARAQSAGTTGVFNAAYRFTIGPAISINAPAAIRPLNGAQTVALVTFTVTNAVRQGPAGPLVYRFEIATNSAFSPVAITAAIPEGQGQTSFAPAVELTGATTYFWRATALDQTNGITSTPSTTQSFVTSLAIDLSRVVYVRGPNVANWPRTALVTAVEQDGADPGPMCIRWENSTFWPDVPFFGDPNFGVYANQWYFANIGGTWYGGAGEWLYRGGSICKNGQGTFTIGPDSGFAPPFNTWAPKVGELVGLMITSPARQYPSMRSVDERSQVVLVPWRDTSRGPNTGGVYPTTGAAASRR